MKDTTTPDCFGQQGEMLLRGESAECCLDCTRFDRCHKITVASSLLSLSDDFDLIIRNGLVDGRLKNIDELDEIEDAEEDRDGKG
jgi:hypothetical protein